jgi:hypothetical protein
MAGNWDHIKKQKGFKSGLEENIANQLKSVGIEPEYETVEVKYKIPETRHIYKPDFRLPNGILIESKGWFLPDDRKKHLFIKKQNPELDIRFILQSPGGKIYKGSKTTYAQWCDKNGFKWAKKEIPQEWIIEASAETFFG